MALLPLGVGNGGGVPAAAAAATTTTTTTTKPTTTGAANMAKPTTTTTTTSSTQKISTCASSFASPEEVLWHTTTKETFQYIRDHIVEWRKLQTSPSASSSSTASSTASKFVQTIRNDGDIPSYKGMTLRPSGKWQAQMYFCGKSRYIGVFDSKFEAALAYEIQGEKIGRVRFSPLLDAVKKELPHLPNVTTVAPRLSDATIRAITAKHNQTKKNKPTTKSTTTPTKRVPSSSSPLKNRSTMKKFKIEPSGLSKQFLGRTAGSKTKSTPAIAKSAKSASSSEKSVVIKSHAGTTTVKPTPPFIKTTTKKHILQNGKQENVIVSNNNSTHSSIMEDNNMHHDEKTLYSPMEMHQKFPIVVSNHPHQRRSHHPQDVLQPHPHQRPHHQYAVQRPHYQHHVHQHPAHQRPHHQDAHHQQHQDPHPRPYYQRPQYQHPVHQLPHHQNPYHPHHQQQEEEDEAEDQVDDSPRINGNSTPKKVRTKKSDGKALHDNRLWMEENEEEESTPTKTLVRDGHWTESEHNWFIDGMKIFGPSKWKRITGIVGTRTTVQIKTHAQSYFRNGGEIPDTIPWTQEEEQQFEMCLTYFPVKNLSRKCKRISQVIKTRSPEEIKDYHRIYTRQQKVKTQKQNQIQNEHESGKKKSGNKKSKSAKRRKSSPLETSTTTTTTFEVRKPKSTILARHVSQESSIRQPKIAVFDKRNDQQSSMTIDDNGDMSMHTDDETSADQTSLNSFHRQGSHSSYADPNSNNNKNKNRNSRYSWYDDDNNDDDLENGTVPWATTMIAVDDDEYNGDDSTTTTAMISAEVYMMTALVTESDDFNQQQQQQQSLSMLSEHDGDSPKLGDFMGIFGNSCRFGKSFAGHGVETMSPNEKDEFLDISL